MSIYPPGSVILAPLSGYTDLPYRRSARRFGCRFAFTEMIDACSLVYDNHKTGRMLCRGDDEAWLGVQLVGGPGDNTGAAAELLNHFDFDVLDFNLGCPVPKVARKSAGAALGAMPEQAVRVFSSIVAKSRFPVTAKIRILHETDPEPTIHLVRLLEQSGAQAITIHGRIRTAFYSGPVFYDIIKAVRETAGIQIIANGGAMDAASAGELKSGTGCDAIMTARGAMGNPWLFRELSDGIDFRPPSARELAEETEKHIMDIVEFHGEQQGWKIARKTVLDYLRGRGYHRSLKNEASSLDSREAFSRLLEKIKAGPAAIPPPCPGARLIRPED